MLPNRVLHGGLSLYPKSEGKYKYLGEKVASTSPGGRNNVLADSLTANSIVQVINGKEPKVLFQSQVMFAGYNTRSNEGATGRENEGGTIVFDGVESWARSARSLDYVACRRDTRRAR